MLDVLLLDVVVLEEEDDGDGAVRSLYRQKALPTRTCSRVQYRTCFEEHVLYLMKAQDSKDSMVEHLLANSTEDCLSISWLQSARETACQSNLLTRARDVLSTHGCEDKFIQCVAELAAVGISLTLLLLVHDIS